MFPYLREHIVKMSITPLQWLSGIICIILIRFFLESLSNPSSTGIFEVGLSSLIHGSLFFFAAIALPVMITLKLFTTKLKEEILKFTIFIFAGILIPPIIDLIINGIGGSPMIYILDTPANVLKLFIFVFSNTSPYGITLGQKIGVFIILIALFNIIYFSSKSIIKALQATLFFYTIMFFLCALPSILTMLGGEANNPAQIINFLKKSIFSSNTVNNYLESGLTFSNTIKLLDTGFNFLMAKIFFILSLFLTFIWFLLIKKSVLWSIIKNSRPFRALNYGLIMAFGMFLACQSFPDLSLNWNDWISIICLLLALYLSGMYAVCINDIEDVEIDKITNPDRPLAMNKVTKEEMRVAAFIFLISSLVGSYLAGFLPLFFIIIFIALYQIYSAPPIKLKILPFVSSIIIGFCCLAIFLAGFYLLSPLKLVSAINPTVALGIFLFFFLFWHMRDIKDIEGDRNSNIITTPILFGARWGKKIVGVISSLSFFIIPILSQKIMLWLPSIAASILTYYFINRKKYSEGPIFIVYIVFILINALILFF